MDIYITYNLNMNILKLKSKYLISTGQKEKIKNIETKYSCPLCGQYKYWCICNKK